MVRIQYKYNILVVYWKKKRKLKLSKDVALIEVGVVYLTSRDIRLTISSDLLNTIIYYSELSMAKVCSHLFHSFHWSLNYKMFDIRERKAFANTINQQITNKGNFKS